MAIKGEVPSAGYLGLALAFVSGTLGSTAAIHFVFAPYVYSIERIPIRKCHYQPKGADEEAGETKSEDVAQLIEPSTPKDFLLKARSKGLFLREIETVFDPCTDISLYKGLRPLCNLQIKDRNLYVHPEFVYDDEMRRQMNLDTDRAQQTPKENPDDEFI